MYKAQCKKWGYTKNIRTAGKLDGDDLQAALVETLYSPGSLTEVRLPDGRVVGRQKYATHLRRRTRDCKCGKAPQACAPVTITPPECFYVVESLLESARTYVMFRHEDAAAACNGESSRSRRLSPSAFDALRRKSEARWEQWIRFSYSVKNALEEKRFQAALVLMRQAPAQLCLWVKGDSINVLSGLLMLVTYCARFGVRLDGWEQEAFLKVLKALMKYADQYAASQMSLPRGHPLRRAVQVLSLVDNSLFRQAVQKAWALTLHTQDEVLGTRGSVAALMDWTHFNSNAIALDYPRDFDELLNDTLRDLEARQGEGHSECVQLLRRKVVYAIEKDAAEGKEFRLNQSHVVTMAEIIRRDGKSKWAAAAFRFFAEHHRIRGENTAALRNLRASITCLMGTYGERRVVGTGFVAELRDWAVAMGDDEEVANIDSRLDELQRLTNSPEATLPDDDPWADVKWLSWSPSDQELEDEKQKHLRCVRFLNYLRFD